MMARLPISRRDFLKTAIATLFAGILTAYGIKIQIQMSSEKQTDSRITSPKYTVNPKALVQTEAAPVQTGLTDEGTLFLDFGKAAFGTLLILDPREITRKVLTIHLGEKLTADGRIDKNPPGSIRYCRIKHRIDPDQNPNRLIIPPDQRNTGPAAIKMPDHIGEVYPFRYAEIEDAADFDPLNFRQIRVHYPFDDDAASFESSNSVLNAVWELCKYSIKATTFCGVYVDGDRERIPYEGDAYINQLGHYCVDSEYALARYTHEYLIQYPTWPTEWQFHSVMMAWEDFMYTGETRSLEVFYDDLCVKTLIDLARDDGLISTETGLCTKEFEQRLNLYHDRYIFDHGLQDLVDWPPGSFTAGGQGERDDHDMRPINSVVNAFHYRALVLMSKIAGVLKRAEDQARFADQADKVRQSINQLLFDQTRGVYIDGEDSTHASLHSNMFMLAFDVVPEERRQGVVSFVKSRGMACSVYGAQFLLEALYKNNESDYALELLTAQHDRSWWHMIQSGSTITMEAWDWKYKNNLDWNHAWGAAPANIIPRYLMGIRPLEPGYKKILIQPQFGALERAQVKHPTIRGDVAVQWVYNKNGSFILDIEIPEDSTARVDFPLLADHDPAVVLDGKLVAGIIRGNFVVIDPVLPGRHRFEKQVR